MWAVAAAGAGPGAHTLYCCCCMGTGGAEEALAGPAVLKLVRSVDEEGGAADDAPAAPVAPRRGRGGGAMSIAKGSTAVVDAVEGAGSPTVAILLEEGIDAIDDGMLGGIAAAGPMIGGGCKAASPAVASSSPGKTQRLRCLSKYASRLCPMCSEASWASGYSQDSRPLPAPVHVGCLRLCYLLL